MINNALLNRIRSLAASLYGCDEADDIVQLVSTLIGKQPIKEERQTQLTQADCILITYGDLLRREGTPPLRVLHEFLTEHLKGTVSAVHILPFYPYSSDDGFSVVDYWQVNDELGSWDDVSRIAQEFDLMVDAVVNHISAESTWFKAYLRGEPEYQDYFIEADPSLDYSQVVRPRALPLLTEFETSMGRRYLWTTFSADQIDLNFASPKVLKEWIKLFFFYIQQGARFIRLDAVGFLWKQLGTSCIHLPQTHQVVQLLRAVAELADPSTKIITETNVPHRDNISYFGDGRNEAHLVYQFPLPPLVLHTFITRDCRALSQWAQTLDDPPGEATFLNFLASHDGVGVMPVVDLLSTEERDLMIETIKRRGGYVSYKHNPDGTESPYELNINYLSALFEPGDPQEHAVRRFLAAHSILLSLMGVPAIYMHSMLGSLNYEEGVRSSGIKRRINREKLSYAAVVEELTQPRSIRSQVFAGIRHMLEIRKNHRAFDPKAPQEILCLNNSVFTVKRGSRELGIVISLNNVSAKPETVFLSKQVLNGALHAVDLLTSVSYSTTSGGLELTLQPYQACWLRIIDG
jgi:glycosidase